MKLRHLNIFPFALSMALLQLPLLADGVKSPQNPQTAPSDAANGQAGEIAEKKNSVEAALKWLHLIDEAKYAESWDAASLTLRLKIPKNYWVTLMENIRKPMGSLISRKLLDQRTAKNPAGLPKGDYMVLVFQASFSRKESAKELVTLVQESDGRWRVLTYQVQ